MSEWWTYRISSFLLFSPRTYYRLFEIYNLAIWPAQIAAIILGLAIVALAARVGVGRGRSISGALAACWLFVAIAFHALRYATINWGAVYFAWALRARGCAADLDRRRSAAGCSSSGRATSPVGWDSASSSLRSWWSPWSAPCSAASGEESRSSASRPTRPRSRHSEFSCSPEGSGRWVLMVVPAVWCAVTGAFLTAMKAPDAWIAPAAAVVVVAMAVRQGAVGGESSVLRSRARRGPTGDSLLACFH